MPERPNIILIYPDQLRHDMLGCYGHPTAITPHIDALAESGTRFANTAAIPSACRRAPA